MFVRIFREFVINVVDIVGVERVVDVIVIIVIKLFFFCLLAFCV